MELTDEQLDQLTDDGDTVKLDDDRILRLRIEPDDSTSLEDWGDCYGKLAEVEWDSNTGQPRNRPEGFDGRAHKVSAYNNGETYWWQPPYDMGMPEDDLQRSKRAVIDLLTYGFMGMVLELCDGTDAYGRPIVVDASSLWGIEPFADEAFRRDIVGDLAAELDQTDD